MMQILSYDALINSATMMAAVALCGAIGRVLTRLRRIEERMIKVEADLTWIRDILPSTCKNHETAT